MLSNRYFWIKIRILTFYVWTMRLTVLKKWCLSIYRFIRKEHIEFDTGFADLFTWKIFKIQHRLVIQSVDYLAMLCFAYRIRSIISQIFSFDLFILSSNVMSLLELTVLPLQYFSFAHISLFKNCQLCFFSTQNREIRALKEPFDEIHLKISIDWFATAKITFILKHITQNFQGFPSQKFYLFFCFFLKSKYSNKILSDLNLIFKKIKNKFLVWSTTEIHEFKRSNYIFTAAFG